MLEAMDYEHLIRTAYSSGRTDDNGANADIYRRMEHAINDLKGNQEAIKKKQMRPSTLSIDELDYRANVATIKVARKVDDAIRHVLNKNPHLLDDTQKKLLSSHMTKLSKPSKRVIDSVIEESYQVFKQIGLTME